MVTMVTQQNTVNVSKVHQHVKNKVDGLLDFKINWYVVTVLVVALLAFLVLSAVRRRHRTKANEKHERAYLNYFYSVFPNSKIYGTGSKKSEDKGIRDMMKEIIGWRQKDFESDVSSGIRNISNTFEKFKLAFSVRHPSENDLDPEVSLVDSNDKENKVNDENEPGKYSKTSDLVFPISASINNVADYGMHEMVEIECEQRTSTFSRYECLDNEISEYTEHSHAIIKNMLEDNTVSEINKRFEIDTERSLPSTNGISRLDEGECAVVIDKINGQNTCRIISNDMHSDRGKLLENEMKIKNIKSTRL